DRRKKAARLDPRRRRRNHHPARRRPDLETRRPHHSPGRRRRGELVRGPRPRGGRSPGRRSRGGHGGAADRAAAAPVPDHGRCRHARGEERGYKHGPGVPGRGARGVARPDGDPQPVRRPRGDEARCPPRRRPLGGAPRGAESRRRRLLPDAPRSLQVCKPPLRPALRRRPQRRRQGLPLEGV
ncbi:MAG: ATP:Cob(I)alamin adenosyltransferase, partial [uncultured Rubrobacteraceae bacterium]